jgi:polysaccharide pyruvyl transferase WcaK-like protein
MAALALANFRSYRDESSKRYLKAIGLWTENDPVYPDLAFSLLPGEVVRPNSHANARRLVVGIGLMEYAGKYSVERPTNHVQAAYLESLVEFVRWLLANGYDVRLLIGDLNDRRVVKEFLALLKRRSVVCDDDRITYEPVESFWDVLSQIAATDFVVATRFHTILFSVLMNKPVSAISFHHKCTSLMSSLGLEEYCHDINRLDANQLIEHFLRLEKNSQRLKASTAEKVKECRAALDDQYRAVIRQLFRAGDQTPATCTVESEAVPRPVDVNTRKGPK